MKKTLLYSLVLACMVGSVALVQAQTSSVLDETLPTGYVQLENLKIESISGTTLPATISAYTDTASLCRRFDSAASTSGRIAPCAARPTLLFTIQVTEKTTLLLRDRKPATFADFKVGDRMNVYGFRNAKTGTVQAGVMRSLSDNSFSTRESKRLFQLNNVEVVSGPPGDVLPATITVVQRNLADCLSFATEDSRGSRSSCPASQYPDSQKYEVSLGVGTTLLDRVRTPIGVGAIQTGDVVNIYGSYLSNDLTRVTAAVLRDLSIPRSSFGTSTIPKTPPEATSTRPTPLGITISNITPSTGSVGTMVRLSGYGFSNAGNTVTIGSVVLTGITPVTKTALSGGIQVLEFQVPTSLIPGTYSVSVRNEGGSSNAVSFTVVALTTDGVVSVESFGAKGNDQDDDAPAIQKALDSLKTTGGTLYFPSGTYLLNSIAAPLVTYPGAEIERSAVMVRGENITLRGAGNASILKLGPNLKAHILEVSYGKNISIQSLAFDGNKANRNGSVPFPGGDVVSNVVSVVYSSSVRFSRVEAYNGLEDGIGFWKSEDGSVTDSYLHDNGTTIAGASGVSYSGSKRGVIARNTLERNTAVNIWAAYGTDTVTIEDNIVRGSNQTGIVLGGYAPDLPFFMPNTGYTVRRNTVTGNAWNGIEITGLTNSTIDENTVLDNLENGIVIANQDARYQTKDVRVRGNTVGNSNTARVQHVGIHAKEGSGVDLRKNTVYDNGTWLGNQIYVENALVNSDWSTANAQSYTPPSRTGSTTTQAVPPTSISGVPPVTGSKSLQVTGITPSAGYVGTSVTLVGAEFGTASDNIVLFGSGAIGNVQSSNDGTQLTFVVPSALTPECALGTPACAVASVVTTPGVYSVAVKNARGTSNSVSFTVQNPEKSKVGDAAAASQLASLIATLQTLLDMLSKR